MRRLLSILLLAAFALPIAAPALALAQDADAGLPACCRRHGQHHCGMLVPGRNSTAHSIAAVCAMWPQRELAPSAVCHPFVGRSSALAVSFGSRFSPAAHPTPHRPTTRDRSHSLRGPPRLLSAI
jgi:hypothetical protein